MSKVVDPLGILGLVIIKAKIFVQQLWKANLDWDDPLSKTFSTDWKDYRLGLAAIGCLIRLWPSEGIRRRGKHATAWILRGIIACFTVESIGTDGAIATHLLTAKPREAPLQALSIHRLKLCSTVLSSKLFRNVSSSLNITTNAYFRSDSSITHNWLHNSPTNFNTSVANRVAEV